MSPRLDPARRSTSVATFIRTHREDILASWERSVRSMSVARRLDRLALRDHMPQVLERVARAAEGRGRDPRPAPVEEHAWVRLEEGFDLREVLTEIAVLRECIATLWSDAIGGAPGADELRALHRALDHAVGTTADRYLEARDRTLRAIDRVAAAALEARDLSAFLRELLAVIVESPSVDTAAVLLREGDELRIRAAVGLDEELARRFTVNVGDGFAGTIAERAEPLELRDAAHHPLLRSPVLRARGVRTLYGVPLVDRGAVIGVLHVGSLTAHELSAQERAIVDALAARASTAIALHVLRDAAETRAAELDAVLEAIPDAVWIGDAERLTRLNRAARELVSGADATGPIERAPLMASIAARDAVSGEPLAPEDSPLGRALSGCSVERELEITPRRGGPTLTVRVAAAPVRVHGRTRSAVAITTDVTARREHERSLVAARREAEQTAAVLDALFRSTLVGLGFVGRDMRYVRVNEALADLNGRSPHEHEGRTLAEVLGPEAAGVIEPLVQRVVGTGEPIAGMEVTIPDGMRGAGHTFVATYAPVRTAGGEILGVSAAVLDITDRKRAEDALRVSEARLRGILDHAPLMVSVKDAAGRYQIANARTCDVLGRAPEDVLGRTDHDLMPAAYADEMRAHDEACLRGGVPTSVEERLPARDGRVLTLITTRFPVPGPGGTPLVGRISTDISERKRAEVEQQLLVDATAASESLDAVEIARRLAAVVVPALADWCVIDPEDGSDRDGATESEVATWHADPEKRQALAELGRERPPTRDPRRRAVTEPVLRPTVDAAALAAGARDARQLELLRQVSVGSYLEVPLLARGRRIGAIALARRPGAPRFDGRDVELTRELARRTSLAIENAALYADAQLASRMREDVLAVVSHDLRSPLGAVRGAGEILARRLAGSEDEKLVHVALRGTARMDQLIRDLLDVASIQQGRFSVAPRTELVERVLVEALEEHRAQAREKQIAIELAPGSCVHEVVLCDGPRVQQVLANLLGNALKFCKAGDCVRIGAHRAGGEIAFEVADTGPGIATDELPHVFEPYWSGKRHRARGTGLGLSIARAIVEAHGGRISVDSTPGAGSTFRFTLPRSG